jgi:tetratricopeptide (TPR) repeat protein
MSELSRVLCSRYLYAGDKSDLDETVKLGTQVIAILDAQRVTCPIAMALVGKVLSYASDATGMIEYRDTSERVFGVVIASCPAGHPSRVVAYQTLGYFSFRKYHSLGTQSLLDDAIGMQQKALSEIGSSDNGDRAINLSLLGQYFGSRYDELAQLADLEQCPSLHKTAVEICPSQHLERSNILYRLCRGLVMMFELSGVLQDLHAALKAGRDALSLCPPNSPARVNSLSAVANLLAILFDVSSASEFTIEEQVKLRREALYLAPLGHHAHLIVLDNLACALHVRFVWNGSLTDLEEAIELRRRTLSLRSSTDSSRWITVTNLAPELISRYRELHRVEDLEVAVRLYREVGYQLSATNPGHHEPLFDMISALSLSFEVLQNEKDVDEAIDLSKRLIEHLPQDHPNRPRAILRLSSALYLRGKF